MAQTGRPLLPRHLRVLIGACASLYKSGVTYGETATDSDTCGDASGVTAGETAQVYATPATDTASNR
jgi:hypothetical protein